MDVMSYFKVGVILSTVVYSILGLVLLAVGFVVAEKLTPFSMTKELCEGKNVAVGIVIAGLMIAQAIIIAAVISS